MIIILIIKVRQNTNLRNEELYKIQLDLVVIMNSDSYHHGGGDNLPGYQNVDSCNKHLIPLLPSSLKLITHSLYIKDFFKHQRKIFLPLRKTDLKRALLKVLNGV